MRMAVSGGCGGDNEEEEVCLRMVAVDEEEVEEMA